MTKVISFISRKGGTGKTTSAINLATSATKLGKTLALIETDTNYTLSTLRNIELSERKTKKIPFEIYGSEDERVLDDLNGLHEQGTLDFIIVDSAGKTTNENIKRLALESDIIVIPTSLTKNDYLVTYQTVEDLKPAVEHNARLRLLIIPNRIHSATKTETIEKALGNIDAHILSERVPQKNIYANFSTLDHEPEFLLPAKGILDFLNNH